MNTFSPADRAVTTREVMTLSWLTPIGLLGLSLYNFAMRLLTLGIYHFWGKTEVRRRIWSAIRVNGEPIEYTGTGGELFLGFLVIFAVVLIPVSLVTFGAVLLFGPGSIALGIFQVLLYTGFMLLTGIAIYRAQRFRLSRTRWRGIRARLDGSSWTYGWAYFWTLLTLPATLGWSAPWRSTKLQRIMTNDMRFGTLAFSFSASSTPLYLPFALFWVAMAATGVGLLTAVQTFVSKGPMSGSQDGEIGMPPDEIAATIGMIYGGLFLAGMLWVILSSWYRAATIRHFTRHTHLGDVSFESHVTARGLLWVAVTNYLILILGATVVMAAAVFASAAVLPLLAPAEPALLADEAAATAVGTILGMIVLFVFVLSLGMLLPVAQARSTGYLVRNMSLAGSLDVHAIAAGAEPTGKLGEGLAQAFDIDAL